MAKISIRHLYKRYGKDKHPGKAQELEAELRKVCSPEAEDERVHQFQAQQLEALKVLKEAQSL